MKHKHKMIVIFTGFILATLLFAVCFSSCSQNKEYVKNSTEDAGDGFNDSDTGDSAAEFNTGDSDETHKDLPAIEEDIDIEGFLSSNNAEQNGENIELFSDNNGGSQNTIKSFDVNEQEYGTPDVGPIADS